jgi:hypothetical protein
LLPVAWKSNSALGSGDAMTASMSVMVYIKTTTIGKAVTIPISIQRFMIMGIWTRGFGISSEMCITASVAPKAYLVSINYCSSRSFDTHIGFTVPSTHANPCGQPLTPRSDLVMYKEKLECLFIARVMTKVRINPDSDIKSADEVIFGTDLGIKY